MNIFKKRLYSFKYAFQGIFLMFREEPNSIIHAIVTLLVVITGFYFGISNLEWIAVIIAIGIVFSMELLNSAIENIADFISPEYHNTIKKVKDLSAGAVLITAIAAAIIGLIIFIPYIIEIF